MMSSPSPGTAPSLQTPLSVISRFLQRFHVDLVAFLTAANILLEIIVDVARLEMDAKHLNGEIINVNLVLKSDDVLASENLKIGEVGTSEDVLDSVGGFEGAFSENSKAARYGDLDELEL